MISLNPGAPWPTAELNPSATTALLRARTRRLLETARSFDDDAVREPSGLPNWTRGHLLTHIARNGQAIVNLCTWANTGVETPMYASQEQRNADIEAGAKRSAEDLVLDVTESADAVNEALDGLPQGRWLAEVRHGSLNAARPAWWIPMLRLGEIELHHTDLLVEYGPSSWASAWARNALPEAIAGLDERAGEPIALQTNDTDLHLGTSGGRTVKGSSPDLLAWVTGRSDGDGLTVDPAGELPDIGAWR